MSIYHSIYLFLFLYSVNGGKCTTLQVGNSPHWSATKTVNIDDRYICPAFVDKHVWIGGYTNGDIFSVEQGKGQVVVTRLDEHYGWAMNLRFKCCAPGTTGKSVFALRL